MQQITREEMITALKNHFGQHLKLDHLSDSELLNMYDPTTAIFGPSYIVVDKKELN